VSGRHTDGIPTRPDCTSLHQLSTRILRRLLAVLLLALDIVWPRLTLGDNWSRVAFWLDLLLTHWIAYWPNSRALAASQRSGITSCT
jgi:hypothetical protein